MCLKEKPTKEESDRRERASAASDSYSEDEIDSIDLLMESYVNLEKHFEKIAEEIEKQTGMLKEILQKLN